MSEDLGLWIGLYSDTSLYMHVLFSVLVVVVVVQLAGDDASWGVRDAQH